MHHHLHSRRPALSGQVLREAEPGQAHVAEILAIGFMLPAVCIFLDATLVADIAGGDGSLLGPNAALGMMLALALPWSGGCAVERQVMAVVDEVGTDEETSVERAAQRLRPIARLCPGSLWPLREALDKAVSRRARNDLEALYVGLTGKPLHEGR